MTTSIFRTNLRERFVPNPDLSDPGAADGANPELNRILPSIGGTDPVTRAGTPSLKVPKTERVVRYATEKSVSDRRQKAGKKRVSNRNSGLCHNQLALSSLMCGLIPGARTKVSY